MVYDFIKKKQIKLSFKSNKNPQSVVIKISEGSKVKKGGTGVLRKGPCQLQSWNRRAKRVNGTGERDSK